jgi:DNA-binding NtrC family response regulator
MSSSRDLVTEVIVFADPSGVPQHVYELEIMDRNPRRLALDGRVRVLVGAAPSCDIVLEDPSVSRRHAALEPGRLGLRVTDLGSANGTYLHESRIGEAWVTGNGEELRFGGTRVRVLRSKRSLEVVVARAASFGRVLGASPAMRALYPMLANLAQATVPVLIEGETGVGKELLAEALHEQGPHSAGPFIVFDPSTAREETMVSRILGDETGRSALDEARGGTLLIDEVTELSQSAQAWVARLLQQGTVQHATGRTVSAQGVRLIFSSRRDIEAEVQRGRFREDLAFMLKTRVELPPLRSREGDVELLARHYWSLYAGQDQVLPSLSLRRFESYSWPGNIRELGAAVQALAVTGSDETNPIAFFEGLSTRLSHAEVLDQVLGAHLPLAQARALVTADFERRYVEAALARAGGNVTRAAAQSGVARRYFQTLKAKRPG